MKILTITPIYPSAYSAPNATPLVHYYTRKWVEQGHEVKVVHVNSVYPKFFYWLGRHFNNFISSKLGMAIATQAPWPYQDTNEGVEVFHAVVPKFVPHGRYNKKAVAKILAFAGSVVESYAPDVIVGHWANPSLEVLAGLKSKYRIRCGIVLHENAQQLQHYYKEDTQRLLDGVDVIGYRSKTLKEDMEKTLGVRNSFMAYSGVPESFLETAAQEPAKTWESIKNFVFVGALIQRKYPAEILSALTKVYPDNDFSMTYIGAGAQDAVIRKFAEEHQIADKVVLTGKIPRADIMEHLKRADVFIMISRAEVYGLVYLEAMAFGCIPVASRNEGFDGIIVDGENGFLCEAGNVEELSEIIAKIKRLPQDELARISSNAKATAMQFGDGRVAEEYINNVAGR